MGAALADLTPELVWGVFTRGLGVVFLCAFLSLAPQVVPEAGRRAGVPVARKLARIRRDFPGWRRFAYFPTLLWLADGDAALRAIVWAGCAAAGLVIHGGPFSFWALLACYVCYLSLDVAVGLIFPWECLLFESALLALWLPATHALPDLRALASPPPALSWAYRLLLFRVMLGFGKQKFLGSTRKDLAYLKSFLLTQPLPTPLGWYAQKLPVWVLRGALLFMMFAELVVPFFMFVPGTPSVVAAIVTATLMVGIQLAGNFGFFNLITLVVCLPLLDGVSPGRLELAEPVVVNGVVAIHTLASLLLFPLNSWLAQTWTTLSVWYRLPALARLPIAVLRALHPLRWLHPYGVFPPNNAPSMKVSLLVEASWDREQWHELAFRYSPSSPSSAPRFLAPHHPRLDQSVIYEALGLNSTSLVSSLVGPFDPYAFGAPTAASILAQRILEGRAGEVMQGVVLERHATPPLLVRMRTIALEPASLREHGASGRWWKRSHLGPHLAARALDPDFAADLLPEPELWHFEAISWRARCPSIVRLMRRARERNDDPMQLALLDADGLCEEDVARFWDELVPLVAPHRGDFERLPEVVQAVHARFTRAQRRALFRLVGRFSLMLVAGWEPLYLGKGRRPTLAVESYFGLWTLAEHVIGRGRAAFLSAFAEPAGASAELSSVTPQTGLYYFAIFRLDSLVMDAQKLRMLRALSPPYGPRPATGEAQASDWMERSGKWVSGFFGVMPVLRDSFEGKRFDHGCPESYPSFEQLATGEIVVRQAGRDD